MDDQKTEQEVIEAVETKSFVTPFSKEMSYEDLGIAPILNGKSLIEAIEKASDERIALVEGLFYVNTTTQIFSDDGLGKSFCLLNACLEMSSGRPVFGALACPRPLRIIYLVCERPLDEPFERIKSMRDTLKPNFDNLVFDKEIQRWDMKKDEDFGKALLRIIELASVWEGGHFDLLALDPLYAIIGGGLSTDENAHAVNNFMRKVQLRHGCAFAYTHHTNRGQKKENSSERHDGDMYGSRFLSANLTGQFHLKKTEDGVELVQKKDTYGNLLKHIPLVFDDMKQTLTMSQDADSLGKSDKIFLFLRKKHAEHREFVLREISNQLKVSDAYIRKVINPLLKNGSVVNRSKEGVKGVYFVEKSI